MVYTKARLEHAIRVFRAITVFQGSARYRSRRSLNGTYLDQHLNRELRRTTRSSQARAYQSWNFSGAQNDSDEDEYDPVEDRRRLKAPRRKKKDATLKRKSSDTGDEERVLKKTKGGEPQDLAGDAEYLTLKLTSQKGRERLEELSHDRKIKREYFGLRSGGSRRRTSHRESGDFRSSRRAPAGYGDMGLGDELMDINDRELDVETRQGLYENLAQTSLRSGRVLLRKVEDNTNDRTNQSNYTTLSNSAENNDSRQQIPLRSAAPQANRSTGSNDGSFAVPIEIDSSDEDRSVGVLQINNRREPTRSNSAISQSTHAPVSTLFRPKIEQFETAFAHPINFKLFPRNGAPECHFCRDWTMAVIGLGKKYVTATRNPKKPAEYQELANGNRAEGYPPTEICVKCSLDRLLMMRCHSPLHQPEQQLPINRVNRPFSRIRDHELTRLESYRYLNHLFTRLRRTPGMIMATYPIPACSLCPQPATWKCSKWQERDQGRRLCQVPEVEPVVISLIDSSDDDEPPSRIKATLPRNSPPSSRSVRQTITPIATNKPPTQPLRPPLQGCGLTLCNTCHTFVTQSCGGLLPKSRILDYLLKKTRLGVRADAEWLFPGSLLEEAFEAPGTRK